MIASEAAYQEESRLLNQLFSQQGLTVQWEDGQVQGTPVEGWNGVCTATSRDVRQLAQAGSDLDEDGGSSGQDHRAGRDGQDQALVLAILVRQRKRGTPVSQTCL